MIALIALAHADPVTESFGAEDDEELLLQGEIAANAFTVTMDVDLLQVDVYLRDADIDCNACTSPIYLWTGGSGNIWTSDLLTYASATDTWNYTLSTISVEGVRLEAGKSYAIGVYAKNFSIGVPLGSEATDPFWGEALGWYSDTYSGAMGTWSLPTTGDSSEQVRMNLTVQLPDDDADGYDASVDCDDQDAAANPGQVETWYDGVDSDCAGDDDYDQDGDGSSVEDDCNDRESRARPGGRETWYDGIDGDCSGGSDYDQDGDGDDVPEGGGGDCDDLEPEVSSLAEETWYDGVDQDCAGDSDFDQDGDGHDTPSAGGDDCDDTDPTVALDCSGGGGGGGIDWGGDDDDDDDDDERGGCLCMAGSAAPALPAAMLAMAAVIRRRRVRRA